MADDHSATIDTTGTVTVGGSATGNIETSGDRDWFAVELVAGQTYRFDLGGSPTGEGTLSDTFLRRILDAEGNKSHGDGAHRTYNDDFEGSRNSRVTFTATESGTYYVETSGDRDETGTYTLSVTDVTPVVDENSQENEVPTPADADSVRTGATDLGDITDLDGPRFPTASLDGDGDRIDYYRFTLSEAKEVGLGLRQQDANADLFVEDAEGTVLHNGAATGTANEWVSATLLAGTYYIRVEAQATGDNDHRLRYGVSVPDPDVVRELEGGRPSIRQSVSEPTGADYSTDATTPGQLVAGESVTGNIATAGDQDWFAVTLEAGTTYRVDLLGSLMDGGTLLDPYLRGIYDSEGTLVSGTENDNRTMFHYSSRVEFMPDADGMYYIAAGANGSHTGTYTLSVEGFGDDYAAGTNTTGAVAVDGTASGDIEYGGDTDWFEVTLEAGKTYQFDLEGLSTGQGTLHDPYLHGIHDSQGRRLSGTMDNDGGVGSNSRVVFTPDADGTYYVAAAGTTTKTGTYRLSVDDVTSDYAADTQTIGSVSVGGTVNSEVEHAHDRDWFAVTLEADELYRIALQGADTGHGTLSDPRLDGVYDSQGNLLSETTDDNGGTGRNSVVDFAPSAAGTYYVSAGANGAETGTYRLEVALFPWEVEVSDAQAREAEGTMRFRVALNTASPTEVTVSYATADGTAVAGSDYEATSGTLTFAAGEREKWVEVSLVDDEEEDSGETFTLRLSGASGAYLADAEAVGTILNTEVLESVSEGDTDLPATTATTGRVVAGESVTGNIAAAGDQDWFAVTLEAGTAYRIDLLGSLADGGTLLDPYLRGIYDSEGTLVSGTENDNRSLFYYSSRVEFMPDADGTYYIAAGANGSHTGTYTLSVEGRADDYAAGTNTTGAVAVDGTASGEIEYGGDSDWFAVTLEAGKTYQFDLEGARTKQGTLRDPYLRGIHDSQGHRLSDTMDINSGVGGNSRVVFTADADGTYYVAAGGTINKTGTYRLSVEEFADDYTARTNTVGAVAVDGTASGEIEYRQGSDRRDSDWFAVTLEAGELYRIDLQGADTGHGTLSDPRLGGVYDSQGNLLSGTTDDNGGTGRNSQVYFAPEADGTYYVAAAGAGAETGTYRLEVALSAWELGVSDVQAKEVDGTMRFRVALNTVSPAPVTVRYETVEGTAVAGADYEATSGTLTFAVGEREKWVEVSLIDDTVRDNGETFTLRLSDATGANLADAEAVGTILNIEVVENISEGATDLPATTATSGGIVVGESVTGNIRTRGDQDWFAVNLEEGKGYVVYLDGGWGSRISRPYAQIYDTTGTLIPDSAVDRHGGAGERYLYFEPDENGTHYISASGRYHHTGEYTLSVTEATDDYAADTDTTGTVAIGGSVDGEIKHKYDRDWFRVTLEADKAYRFDLVGSPSNGAREILYDRNLNRIPDFDPYLHGIRDADGTLIDGTTNDDGGARWNSRVYFAPREAGTYYVVAGDRWRELGDYTLSVTDVTDTFTDAHTADVDTTGTVEVGSSSTGDIEFSNDRDWFAVELEAETRYRIDLDGWWNGNGTLRNPYLLGVYDSDGTRIANTANDDGGTGENSRVYFTPNEAGTYYVAATGTRYFTWATGTQESRGTYRVSVLEAPDGHDPDDFSASTGTTGTVAVGRPATGEISRQFDRDWFAVTLEGGKVYRFDMMGSETGHGTLSSPHLRSIREADGTLIDGTADDGTGEGRSRVDFSPGENGKYYVEAGVPWPEWDQGTYTLSVQVLDEFADDYAAGTDTVGTVEVGGSASGEIEYGQDSDWFAVTLASGRTYQIDLQGDDSGRETLRDPVIDGIHDSNGVVLSGTMNNDGGYGRNSRVVFAPDADGTYYVAAGGNGSHNGTYRVSVEDVTDDDYSADTQTAGSLTVGGSATGAIHVAGDQDWFAVTLEAGTRYRIDLDGSWTDRGTLSRLYMRGVHDSEGTLIADTTNDGGDGLYFTPSEAGTYYVAAGASESDTGTYTLSVTALASATDDFSADTETTGTVAVGGSANGEIESADDRDWFAMTLEAGDTYRIDLENRTLTFPYLLGVYNADGTLREETTNEDGEREGGNRQVTFTPDEDAIYYVAVDESGTDVGAYRVWVQEVEDAI